MKCPQCQTENRPNAKFCNECGCSFALSREESPRGSDSGAIDPRAALRDIPLVAEQDEGFDFTEPDYDQQDAAATQVLENRDSVKDVARDMFPNRIDSGRQMRIDSASGADVTADLTGLVKLVDSSYVPPVYSGRAGDTMEMPPVGASGKGARLYSAAVESKEQKKLEKSRDAEGGKRSKAPLLIALLLVVIAVGAAFATYYLELWGGKVIPDVVGQSQENATYTLEAEGFTVRAEMVKSDDVAGIVLLTDPSGGDRVEEGAEVVIHVSVSRIVPEIEGLTAEQLEEKLIEQGLDNFSFVSVKSNEPEGTILGISVEPGTRALSTTPIEIEVAVPFTVPEVKDLSEAEAKALLEAEGYKVTVRPHYTEEMKEGIAVSTEPAAGEVHKSGEDVVLYVTKSRADELVDLTWSYLSSASSFSIGGMSYEVSSIDSVEFIGENKVEYAMTARYFETHYWFGFEAETRYGDYETIVGTITWSDSNEISGADPTIKKL